MRTVKNIIIAVYLAIFIAGGAGLILISRDIFFNSDVWIKSWLTKITPDGLFLIGISLLVAGLLPALMKIGEVRRSRYVAFDNPEGEVAINLRTIENFVLRAGKSFSEVIRLKAVINPRKKAGVEIFLEADLEEGANIPRLTEAIQQKIKTRLQELLGIENIAGIQINVPRIASREGKAAPEILNKEEIGDGQKDSSW